MAKQQKKDNRTADAFEVNLWCEIDKREEYELPALCDFRLDVRSRGVSDKPVSVIEFLGVMRAMRAYLKQLLSDEAYFCMVADNLYRRGRIVNVAEFTSLECIDHSESTVKSEHYAGTDDRFTVTDESNN